MVNSNLLAYFLETDKNFWADFVEKVLTISDSKIINATPNITRESVGNIDLFIEASGSLIVIENKIKSGINGRESDGYSQLQKYVAVAAQKAKELQIQNIYYYILRPNYNNENYTVFKKGELYKEIKYSEIYEIIKDRSNSDFYFAELKNVVKKHSAEYNNELFEIMNERFIEKLKNEN